MVEKQAIIKAVAPKAVLRALTSEALEAIPYNQRVGDLCCIREFPFNVGRELRTQMVQGKVEVIERRKWGSSKPNNDLYLMDQGELLNISREHFRIEQHATGFRLVDRGSACGLAIGDLRVGGVDAGGTIELKDGDIIAVGSPATPFHYQFIDLESD